MEINESIVVSFDLDFTLIDNREGILNSFNHTFKSFRIDPIKPSLLETTIGEPLFEVFERLTNEDPNKLVQAFREYYRKEGIYQVKIYDGVCKVLKELERAGMTLGVVTSKKRELAVQLLKHLNIFHFFEFVHGETESIKNKTDPQLKDFFYTTYPPKKYNYVIVGDHLSDKKLAEMLQCPFIGVLTVQNSARGLKNGDKIYVETIPHISYLDIKLVKKVIQNKRKK
jgi:phosphoglycolate phosphatase